MPLPNKFYRVDEQPASIEFACVDDIFIKTIPLKTPGLYVPQHSHVYPHISFIATGAVRVWRDGVLMGDYVAPCPILIEAMSKHTFLSLASDTLVLCIHNTHGEGVSIAAEHQLTGG